MRGPIVMNGYWNRPEETATVFRHGWLHTGDIARRDDDGFLTIVDRAKDVIISGGFNVYAREVEDVIAAHEAVASVAVIGIPDERWGEAVTAFVVLGEPADPEELRAWCRERLAPHEVPKRVVPVDELPRNAAGKLVRDRL